MSCLCIPAERDAPACGGSPRLPANSDAPCASRFIARVDAHLPTLADDGERRAFLDRADFLLTITGLSGRWVSDVLAWSWCFGAILFPTAILQAAKDGYIM